MTRLARAAAVMLAAGLACATAFAQAPPPAASGPAAPPKAAASAASSGAGSAGSASAGAASSASAAPSASAAGLPPGHPPTGDMPPGHPPTGDMPPGHPPTGPAPGAAPGNPHGRSPHGGGGRPEIFDAPPDTAEDDANLPVGTIVLTVKDAEERPIPATDVSLGILHNTVATGESRERRSATTDREGMFRWDGMTHGSATSYRVSVTRGKALFGTDPFTLGDRAGKRVVLHVYGVTSDIEEALVGVRGFAYLALRDDAIVIEQLYSIFNLGAVAWVPEDVTIELPEGFKAFNRPDAMDGVGIDEVNGKGVLRGTIGPGRHDVTFRYQIPLDGDDKQTVRIHLPPNIAQMQVMAEAAKTMGLEVPGFEPVQKTKNRDGKRVLVTRKLAERGREGLTSLDVTLTNLPTPGPGRWLALFLGVCALAGGFGYVYARSTNRGPDQEMRRDLVDAREALLRDLVELERRHKSGEIGPKTYERLRGALLDALERLVTRIQAMNQKAPARRSPSRSAGADD